MRNRWEMGAAALGLAAVLSISGFGGEVLAVSGHSGETLKVSGSSGEALAVSGRGREALAVSGGSGEELAVSGRSGEILAASSRGGATLVASIGNSGMKSGQSREKLYGIGSTSKVIVSAAVMKLDGEGKLSLDEPLIRYLPEFEMEDPRYVRITPRMLLNHSSGLQGGTLTNSMLLGDSDTYNHDTLLQKLKTQRLKADPGEFSTYCNDGFTLAELLVERVSGMSFTEYIEHEFAVPLGLENFATPQTPDILKRAAAVYDTQTGEPLPPEMANVIGSGGVYASAVDLCRFSRLFMRDQGAAAGILPQQAAREMEESSYEEAVNPEHIDSTLSYGLGWDSVDTYPFSRYGIKALVKGGDTTFYHSSLTVLPEENASCAVVTSGGSSMAAQLAAQEILMEYLEETGRIVREPEDMAAGGESEAAGEIPEELMACGGLYAGSGLLSLTMGSDGTLTLENRGTKRDKRQVYTYRDDGRFYSTNGNYMDMSGQLVRSSDGRTGKTFLEFKRGEDGINRLMAGTFETYPKLGNTAVYLPVAEQLTEGQRKEDIKETEVPEMWKEQNEKEFYLVSEKSTSSFYLSHFMAEPLVGEESAGYLTFDANELRMADITSEDEARFFQKLPGQAGRDLSDYHIGLRDGNVYLENESYRFIRGDGAGILKAGGQPIVIGKDGDTRWFTFGKEQEGRPVSIKKPDSGAWYVYDHSGKTMRCVASSWLIGDGESFLLPAKGLIAFAGEAGDEFVIMPAVQ